MAGEPSQQVLVGLSETRSKVPGGDGLPSRCSWEQRLMALPWPAAAAASIRGRRCSQMKVGLINLKLKISDGIFWRMLCIRELRVEQLWRASGRRVNFH